MAKCSNPICICENRRSQSALCACVYNFTVLLLLGAVGCAAISLYEQHTVRRSLDTMRISLALMSEVVSTASDAFNKMHEEVDKMTSQSIPPSQLTRAGGQNEKTPQRKKDHKAQLLGPKQNKKTQIKPSVENAYSQSVIKQNDKSTESKYYLGSDPADSNRIDATRSKHAGHSQAAMDSLFESPPTKADSGVLNSIINGNLNTPSKSEKPGSLRCKGCMP